MQIERQTVIDCDLEGREKSEFYNILRASLFLDSAEEIRN